ncbi:hypothetical protein [Marinitenerispora sediminis]|uniref:Uncharacterized protein n=1 Tax=Marinitenerispora sediminis TaxID=1931232 RepID=A0A368TAC5_9ACTN|nr:hypothetical protein [Marinitenerispora sediminis]RCV61853.1 hypothetical protein DEF24_03225 [Marinitenerispora sediminis]
MTLTVIPPLTDPTLEWAPPGSGPLLDLNAAFFDRLADPGRLRAAAECDDTADADSDRSLRVVFGRAAAAVLDRPARDDARLRAIGYALRAAGAADPAIELSLDDLRLRGGTTQSSADVVAAATATGLFGPEVERLRAAAGPGTRVAVLVDTDQQLPAAVAFTRALGPERVEWTGRYVVRYGAALSRVPELRGVRLRALAAPRTVRTEWGAPDGTTWLTDAAEWRPGGAWAGWMDPSVAAALSDEALKDCRGLTVTVAGPGGGPPGEVVGADGVPADLAALRARLDPAAPLRADVVLGAPGVPVAEAAALADGLESAAGGIGLAGFRPFRLAPGARWPAARRLPAGGDRCGTPSRRTALRPLPRSPRRSST